MWLKYKRIIQIVLAIVFLVVLFIVKNHPNLFQKQIQNTGLSYSLTGNELVQDLVNKDTDGDGIPDWQEKLFGTDPTKKETTPGIPDKVAIEQLKVVQGISNDTSLYNPETEKLTQTDKFSQELFATVAAATQDGQPLDQATIDAISSSLAEHVQNTPQRKIYTMADIQVIKDSGETAKQNYHIALSNLYKTYPTSGNVFDIFEKATNEDGSLNTTVLLELTPIIKSKQNYIKGMLKVNVPEILSSSHLGVLNALERLVENLSDIELAEGDIIVAFSAISQYQNNLDSLDSALKNLTSVMN